MVPLVISGDWITMAHQANMLAAPDVCLVVYSTSGVGIRAGEEGVQLRVINSNWALPTRVTGEIQLSIGDWKISLEIDGNTDKMVNAGLSKSVFISMLAAMDKSSTILVTVGKAKPMLVSLNGSTCATNAFKTCARIYSTTKVLGANPFE